MSTEGERQEWRDTIFKLREAAMHTSNSDLLDKARVNMLELLTEVDALTAERDKLAGEIEVWKAIALVEQGRREYYRTERDKLQQKVRDLSELGGLTVADR
jgi:hypothetical protein